MRLIVRDFLQQLKERDELDALLPDLLAAVGHSVVSRPKGVYPKKEWISRQ